MWYSIKSKKEEVIFKIRLEDSSQSSKLNARERVELTGNYINHGIQKNLSEVERYWIRLINNG